MDNDVVARLQYQLNVERQNAQKYFYFGSVASNLAWDGFAHWFMKQGQGELGHAEMIKDFLISKRIQPEYRPLAGVSVESSLIAVTKEAFKTELATTAELTALYQMADESGEHQVCAFLVDLLKEQIEEETVTANLMDLVSKTDENGWVTLDEIYGKK